MNNIYTLPPLPYAPQDLAPFLSEEQLLLHHDKHHQAYVDGANKAIDLKSSPKVLTFHLGGHVLHSLFWENMVSPKKYQPPEEKLRLEVEKHFGSLESFKSDFSQVATSVEGSGWAVLVHEPLSKQLLLMQIEKHNLFLAPECRILLVLDVWEHAYYLDYKNDRAKYVENFSSAINWSVVQKRLEVVSAL